MEMGVKRPVGLIGKVLFYGRSEVSLPLKLFKIKFHALPFFIVD